MGKVLELPSQEYLQRLFYYDNGLKWKEDHKRGCRNVKAGDVVDGGIDGTGYVRVMLGGVRYKLSRLVYQFFNGNLLPDQFIDHANRNRLDNRIENLRAVTPQYNNRNRSKRSDNSTGNTGVTLQAHTYLKGTKSEKEYSAYVAHWTNPAGEQRAKSYSIQKYGEAEAFRLACEHRKAMIQSLIEQGEWYAPTHGT